MKKILIVFIAALFLFAFNLFSQEKDISSKQTVSLQQLKETIREEGESLANLLEQIAYLSRILEKKVLIKALEKQNRTDDIRAVFASDEQQLKDFFKRDKLSEVKNLLFELKLAYKNVDQVTPYLLFYDGKYQLLKGELSNAQMLLEEIVEDYPKFEYLNATVIMLQEVYFRLGLHREFISIYNKSTNLHNNVQKFWLAHSYYGIGEFEKAKEIFVNLQKDKNFGLRAEEMVALISLYTKGVDVAINNFHNLENKVSASKKYYFFIPLTLARLYELKGDHEKALAYYDTYYALQKKKNETIPDDIIFEIAVLNKNAKKYDKALAYFRIILNRPVRSSYYSSARLLATITEQESGKFETIQSGLNEIIKNNDVLEKTLEAKYKLLDKYDKLRKKISTENLTPEEKREITQKLDSIEKMLLNTNKTLTALYSGKDPQNVAIIKILEEEYLYYDVTLDMMDAVVDLANTVPNKRVPKLIDRSIAAEDSSLVTLQLMEYLGHKKNITVNDIRIARALIEEKGFEQKLLKVWEKIYKFAQDHNKDQVKVVASKSIVLVKENIRDLDKIAELAFDGKPGESFMKEINEELASIKKNKEELEELKQEVIKKFNKRIAKRLENQKEVLQNEQIHLKDFYSKILTKVIKEVKEEKNKSKFTLLDILYKQTKALDMEYKNLSEQSGKNKK